MIKMNSLLVYMITTTVMNLVAALPQGKSKLLGVNTMQVDSYTWPEDNIDFNKKASVPPGCSNKPADIYFILDTADDVIPLDIENQKSFSFELLKLFHFGKDSTRISVLSYGHVVKMPFHLGTYNRLQNIEDALQKTPNVGGKRNVANVLKFLRLKAFSEAESRSNVAHVAILFVAGTSQPSYSARLEAQQLRKLGIYLYLVNIDDNIPKKALANLSSKPSSNFVYQSRDYSISESLIKLLRIHPCDVHISPSQSSIYVPRCYAKRPVDVIISLDETSIGAVNSKNIVHFLEALMSGFDDSNHFINIVLLKSKYIKFHKFRKRFETVKDFKNKLGTVSIPEHSDMFRRVRRYVKKGRQNVQKIVLHFVDENVDITKQTLIQAKKNRFSKLQTYVVAVGNHLDITSIKDIASEPNDRYVIHMESYNQLLREWHLVLHRLCKGI